MAVSNLLLGPFIFQDFEIPTSITWGGSQALVIHRLPGGARVIDAMGRDDAEITWSGVFSGPDATLRAQGLDLLRAGGGLWPLTWDSFFYSVVIAKFEAEQRRPNWIPYRIACTVLRDEAAAALLVPISIAAGVAQDLAAAALLAPATPGPTLDAQLAVPIDLSVAVSICGLVAQQAAAEGYLQRAARNQTSG